MQLQHGGSTRQADLLIEIRPDHNRPPQIFVFIKEPLQCAADHCRL
jgi:hypothetical protein